MRIVALLLNLILIATAFASPSENTYEPDFTVVEDNIEYDISADGSYVYQESFVLRINTQTGVDRTSQFPLPFSASLQQLEVLEAYTTTSDGERLDVGKEGMIVQQSPVSDRAPMFSDLKIHYVIFPGVEPGATLHLSYRRKQIEPLFPGHFSTVEKFDISQEFEHASVTVSAPKVYRLNIETVDIEGGEIPSERPGKKVWRWEVKNTTPKTPEIGSVGATDISPRIAISSFNSYGEVGAAYLARANEKVKVTAGIQKLADKITRDISDRRQQAEALYNWVSSNIRYVAIFIEYGGVVPHEAEAILKARYGDCKDHVVLLQALLSAKGIESKQVLLNAINEYWLPEQAPAPNVFNHAITYIPEFDLFLDSTLKLAPFGVLSPLELGKKVLIADTESSQSRLAVIPSIQKTLFHAERVSNEINVSESGNVKLDRRVETTGALEYVARAYLSQLPSGRASQIVGTILQQMGQNGSGKIDMSRVHELDEPFVYNYHLTFPNYVDFTRPGTLQEPLGIPSQTGLINLASSLNLEKRNYAVPCMPAIREENTRISFPKNIKITRVPDGKHIESAFGHYNSDYSISGSTITIKRKLELDLPTTCDGDVYAKLREMARGIVLDIKENYAYQL